MPARHGHPAHSTVICVPAIAAGQSLKESQVNEVTGGDVYTMAEAARLKGVSYHTVSRAVRRGKLPATRLGRMALITSEDLREWRPMRERAPRKYRRREPNPEATPALLDLASAERVELASRLSSLYEALFAAAMTMPRDELFGLITDRLAGTLGLRRVVIWLVDEQRGLVEQAGYFGPPLTTLPPATPLDTSPLARDVMRPPKTVVENLSGRHLPEDVLIDVTSLLVSPIRISDRYIGVIAADRKGEPFELNQGELDLAQAMANIVALTYDGARVQQTAGVA
jgi:excisionase family DNA binding protein